METTEIQRNKNIIGKRQREKGGRKRGFLSFMSLQAKIPKYISNLMHRNTAHKLGKCTQKASKMKLILRNNLIIIFMNKEQKL